MRWQQKGITPHFEIFTEDLKSLYPNYNSAENAPLIGILFNRERKDYAIPESYIYAAIKAGVRVLSCDDPQAQAQGTDGIILTGG